MNVTFGVLDAFAFVVFAVILFVGVFIVVSLGRLPGRLAQRWGHPQAAAVSVAGWLGVATGGLIWPLALIWAFMAPSRPTTSPLVERGPHESVTPGSAAAREIQP